MNLVSSDDVSESERAIMEATYRALCEHGYANLTTQDIAAETDMSKAALHYHYETKQELLVAFLEFLLEGLHEAIEIETDERPAKQLDFLIDRLLRGPTDQQDFQTAMLEFRVQVPYNEAYRNQFHANDEYIRETIARIIERGIDQGEFQDADPDRIAWILRMLIDGARMRAIVFDREMVLDTASEIIDAYLSQELSKE
jgi:AcrR family transcriptional regulator